MCALHLFIEKTNTSEIIPGTSASGMDSQGSPTFQLELSEYDSEVPFKIIKLEHDEVPNMFPVSMIQQPVWTDMDQGPSNMDLAGTSKLPHNTTSSIALDNCASTSTCDVSNEFPQTNDVQNAIISDGYDIDVGGDYFSDIDSECEFISDSDYPCQGKNGAETNGPDALDDGDRNIPTRPPTRKWTALEPTPKEKIEFTKKQELRIPLPQIPYEIFRLFLTDELITIIVRETNKNAALICSHPVVGLKSRFRAWQDVTHKEMITFLGLLIHTGTFRTNRLRDYWNRDYLFNWTCFSKFMKQDRFMTILSCLNFASPTDSRDIIGKIRPIVQNFNTRMTEIYYPGKELFLANPAVLQNGRLVRQKHRDSSRHTDVIKLHMLTDSDGTIIKYQVYYNNINHNFMSLTNVEIVKELLQDYLGNGHIVYMNKHYTSWNLAAELLDSQTYCTGILSKKSRDNLSVCNQNNQNFFLDGVQIGKWDHKKNTPGLYISTECDYSYKQVTDRHGSKKSVPTVIIKYSKYKIDSELQEQLKSYYPCSRKYLRWDKKLFLHSLQIYLRSAYRLYNNYSGKKKVYYYDFRMAILKAMLPEITTTSLPGPHVLTKITKTFLRRRRNKDNSIREFIEIVRKKCQMCKVKHKKETRTIYECPWCEGVPGFCQSCFDEVHSNLPKHISGYVSGFISR